MALRAGEQLSGGQVKDADGYTVVQTIGAGGGGGDATAANQTTIIGHVDTVETKLNGGLPAALAAGGGLKVEGVAGGVAQPVSLAVGQGLTLGYLEIDHAASGSNTVLAAQGAGNRIYVVSYVLIADAAVTAEWRTAATGISGAMSLAANGGVSAIGQPSSPLLRTAANEALNLNLGGAVGVRGHLTYFVAT